MLPNPKIHLLCDAADTFQATVRAASDNTGWSIDVYQTADEFLRKMRLEHHGALIVAPGVYGAEPAMEMIRGLREQWINLPILLVADETEPHLLEVAAIHSGAHDVIRLPTRPEQVQLQVARALEYDRHSAGQPGVIRSRLATLSPKEREVMDLTLTGQSTNGMASSLGVCYQTINKHRARIRLKMRSKCEITLLNNLTGHPPLPGDLGYMSPTPATAAAPAATEAATPHSAPITTPVIYSEPVSSVSNSSVS